MAFQLDQAKAKAPTTATTKKTAKPTSLLQQLAQTLMNSTTTGIKAYNRSQQLQQQNSAANTMAQGAVNLVNAANKYSNPVAEQAYMNKLRRQDLKIYNTGIAPANQFNMGALTPEERSAYYRAPGLAGTFSPEKQAAFFNDPYAEPTLPGTAQSIEEIRGRPNVYGYDPATSNGQIDTRYKDSQNYDLLPDNYNPYTPPGILPPGGGQQTQQPQYPGTPGYPEFNYLSPGYPSGPSRPDVNQWYANMVQWTINRPRGA